MGGEFEDALAKLRADSEQAREGLAEVATSAARFFNELLDGKMTREEALSLTQTWLQMMMNSAGMAGVMKMLVDAAKESEEEGS